jgi:hypothetical protein
MRRALAILGGVVLGLSTWAVLIWLFRLTWHSQGQPGLAVLGFWLSHWTFIGWAFGGVLMYAWYRLLMRLLRRKPPEAADINGRQSNAT